MKKSILELVEELSETLISEDALLRSQGVKNLNEQISSYPLSSQEVHVLFQFYKSRLQDRACMSESIRGMSLLFSLNSSSETQQLTIIKAVLTEVSVQTQAQHIRTEIYQLLRVFLDSYKDQGIREDFVEEFIHGFIRAVDGEKDPRCLIVVFELAERIARTLPLKHSTENFFDIIACYYPIMYKPSMNDPNLVAPETLKRLLRTALCAHESFAAYCFPLVLEKMSSHSIDAKLDAMDMLCFAADRFDSETLKAFFPEIWRGLHHEIFQSTDAKIEEKAFECFGSVLRSQSKLLEVSESEFLKNLLSPIVDECLDNCTGVDGRLRRNSFKVLAVIAGASDPTSVLTSRKIIPALQDSIQKTEDSSLKSDILVELALLTEIVCRVLVSNDEQSIEIYFANESLERLILSLIEGLQSGHDELKQSILRALPSIYEAKLLHDSQIHLIVVHLGYILTDHATSRVLRDKSIQLMHHILQRHPLVVDNSLMTVVRAKLAELKGLNQAEEFSTVAAACFFDDRYFEDFSKTSFHEIPYHLAHSNWMIARMYISSMNQCVDYRLTYGLDSIKTLESYVYPLLALVDQESFGQIIFDHWDDSIFETISHTTGKIVQNLNESEQRALFLCAKKRFNVVAIWDPFHNLKTALLAILKEILCHVRGTILDSDCIVLLPFLTKVLEVSPDNLPLRSIVFALLKCFSNKFELAESYFFEWVSNFMVINDSKKPSSLQIGLESVFHMIDGWIKRMHPSSMDFMKNLLNFAVSNSLSHVLFDSISLWIDEKDIKSSNSFITIHPLFKQRVFIICRPILIQILEEAHDASVAENGMKSLAVLFKNSPIQVTQDSFESAMPVFLKNLRSGSPTTQLGLLDLFENMDSNSISVVKLHAESLVNVLLSLSNHTSYVIRCKALQCLSRISQLAAYHEIHPFRHLVIRQLETAIDDPKRIVRKAAILCRNQWIMAHKDVS